MESVFLSLFVNGLLLRHTSSNVKAFKHGLGGGEEIMA